MLEPEQIESLRLGESEIEAGTDDAMQGGAMDGSAVLLLEDGTVAVDQLRVSHGGPWARFGFFIRDVMAVRCGGRYVLELATRHVPVHIDAIQFRRDGAYCCGWMLEPLSGQRSAAARTRASSLFQPSSPGL